MMENAAEYCLLWIRWWPICMTKSEWASWAQAVFSVLAIAAAIWIGWNTQRGAARGAMNHYILFKTAVRDCIRRTMRYAEAQDVVGLRFGQASIRDAIHLGQTVPIHLLPVPDALASTRYRGVIARASVVIDGALAAGAIQLHYGHIRAELVGLLAELDVFDPVHISSSAPTEQSAPDAPTPA